MTGVSPEGRSVHYGRAQPRHFGRSGYSPDQRTFGRSLRLPGHLLSGDHIDSDLLVSRASDQVAWDWEIREAAAAVWVKARDRRAVDRALAGRARRHQDRLIATGELMKVWRKPSVGKPCWAGPGLLVCAKDREFGSGSAVDNRGGLCAGVFRGNE